MPLTRATPHLSAHTMPFSRSQKHIPIEHANSIWNTMCHAMNETRLTMYHAPESSCDFLTQCLSLCVNNRHFPMTSTDHFLDSFHFIFTIMHFLWVVDFWCRTASSTNQDTFTAFHHWGLCLTIIDGSLT